MNNGKWVDGLSATMPVVDAARHVLAVRLGSVHEHLPPALTASSRDVEAIHQLRVATRRARAALDIFAGSLPSGAYRSARKQLRKIRRAAGPARDWDVFLAHLQTKALRDSGANHAAWDLLVGYALAQRGVAQLQIDALGDDYPDRFAQTQAETLAALRPGRSKQTFLDLARPLLGELVSQIDRGLAGNLEDYAELHRVRIDGKRLRYAMEICADCFGEAFRERLYPAVEAMQEILGTANDNHVALGHLAEMMRFLERLPLRTARRFQPQLEAMHRVQEERLLRQREHFTRWQTRWRRLHAAEICQTAS
jgi:CHAD domain-containing protein